MRIAIIAEVFLPKIDGVVIRTMNLIHHLLARGDEVFVACPAVSEPRNSPVKFIEFQSFPFPSYPEYRIGIPDARLVTALEEFAPDILHYINPFAFGFRCYDVLERAGLNYPSVFSFHTLYGEFVKRYGLLKPLSSMLWWLMRDYHNRAATNLTVSTIMQDELIARGFERVELWPPAVDSALFCPDRATPEMRQRLSGGHPDEPLLLTVSRLAPEKNVAFLADVMARVPKARLAIVGDGPQRAELERLFAGLNATFVGYLKGQELATAYASSDAFVYASETETMGNVVLEAMACGLGVVAPRAGGIPSLLTEGESGLLFDPGDADAAASHLRKLLENQEYRKQMTQAARQSACERDWNNAADRVRQHYLNTIATHPVSNGSKSKRRRLSATVLSSLVTAFRAATLFGKKPVPR